MKKSFSKNFKILVVDDEDLLREALVDALTMNGAICDSAANGTEAFQKLNQNSYDILVTDVRMPGGDGVQLIRQLHESSKIQKKPFVFVSSGFSDVEFEEMRKMGVLHIFDKPYRINDFIETIETKVRDHH